MINIHRAWQAVAVLTLTIVVPTAMSAEAPYGEAWTVQYGTAVNDVAVGVAADAQGNVYATGYTIAALFGSALGATDAYVMSLDAAGNPRWSDQFGSTGTDTGRGIAVQGDAVFVTGETRGFPGAPNEGGFDAYVRRYDLSGNLIWTRALGTSEEEMGRGVAVDGAANVVFTGYTTGAVAGPNAGERDIFVRKLDGDGNTQWTKQLGTTGTDEPLSIAADAAGNVLVGGFTTGSLAGPNAGDKDALLIKFDNDGNTVWQRQFGTSDTDTVFGVVVDGAGNAVVAGRTRGSLAGASMGGLDVFVAKYDIDGALLWSRQFGSAADDQAVGLAIDLAGNIFIDGYTNGYFGGPNAGGLDTFVLKLDADGDLQWVRQLGTAADDPSFAIAVDSTGRVAVAGWTTGNLGAATAGGIDAWVMSLQIPEPGTWLMMLAAAALGRVRRLRTGVRRGQERHALGG